MSEKLEDKRINEALELLNEVAKEKKAELQGMVSEKYGSLKAALGGAGEKLEHEARETLAHGKQEVKELASRIEDRVRQNPWPYLGGTALGFLLLGLFLARPKK
jgi:ElaB/YqjD/DUF883 family membrane-anchored ribosome-binding protein